MISVFRGGKCIVCSRKDAMVTNKVSCQLVKEKCPSLFRLNELETLTQKAMTFRLQPVNIEHTALSQERLVAATTRVPKPYIKKVPCILRGVEVRGKALNVLLVVAHWSGEV